MKNKKHIAAAALILLGMLVFCVQYLGQRLVANNLNGKIKLIPGYEARIVLKGLQHPVAAAIDREGNCYIAENINGKGHVIQYSRRGEYSVLVPELTAEITDLILYRDVLYLSERGRITKYANGELTDLITGLPSNGDYANNGIAITNDGFVYISQGAATNSGVVGPDNYERGWLRQHPYLHDYSPSTIVLSGVNIKAQNPLAQGRDRTSSTGAFLPFDTESIKGEQIRGKVPGNAAILKASLYGQLEETFAYGIRNPVGIINGLEGRLYISVQGMENRGSRPVANGCDYLYDIKKGDWLGWPDYEGSEPVTLKKYRVIGKKQNQFLMDLHPTTNPPKPIAVFKESGRIGLIDMSPLRGSASAVNGTPNAGLRDCILIPLKKGVREEGKVVCYNTKTKILSDFMTENDHSGFLSQSVQCVFSKSGDLYVLEADKGILIKVTEIMHK